MIKITRRDLLRQITAALTALIVARRTNKAETPTKDNQMRIALDGSGYLWVGVGNPDRDGDVILPDAFKDAFEKHKKDKPMEFRHVGVIYSADKLS